MKQNFQQKTHFLFLVITLLLSLNSFSVGQEITGTLVGTVRDSSGAAIAGATVTISDPTKNNTVVRTLTTSDEGVFSAPNLQVSTYSITVEAPNFKKAVQTDVKLDVGARRNVDIALEAGNISETVTVEADAVEVNLSTPTVSTTINGDQVRELSLNNRNFVQLVTLAPGVSSNLNDTLSVGTSDPATGAANLVQISVNGARSSQNTFTVDGADITDRGSNLTIQAYPSIDSIGEFKVLRSLYPAESGRSGGGQVNVVTRSGTDKFHGSLFEFVRNEKFNANSYFNNQNKPLGLDANGKALRAPFRYNNYGLTVGGPVFGPNFGEGNEGGFFRRYKKTYFFFSEEQRKDRRFPTLISSVPDAQFRQGIFPVAVCLNGTISGTTRTCNSILPAGTPLSSVAAINPVAQAYLTNIYNRIPLPNVPNVAFRLVAPASGRSDFRQEIFKIDTSLTKNLTAFYRYQRDNIPTIDIDSLFSSGSGIPGVSTSETNSPGRTHTFQMTYVVNPNIIVEGRYTYAYGAILSNTTGLVAKANSPINVPLPYPSGDDRIPSITGNGFNGLVAKGPYNNFSNKKDFSGNITWIFGNHTTKYGGSFSKYRKNENALGGSNQGSFSGFLNTNAASPTQGTVCVNPTAPTSVGNICPSGLSTTSQLFANFLLGNNASFLQSKYDLTADFRQRNFEAFAQDEWRIRRNLTLYYGVRYSFFGSPWDKNGFLSNFDPSLYNPANAPQVTGAGNRVAGTGNFCNGLIINSQNIPSTLPPNCTPTVSPYGKFVVDAKKRNFAPRVGLAWDPFGKGRTSIRTGYGIYHEQTLVGTFEQNLGTNPPYQETISVSQSRLDQPIPPGQTATVVSSLAAQTLRAEQTDWKTPYMQHWSLDLQQQLTKNTLVTVGYYGSKGTNLIGIVDINLLPPGKATQSQCATGANTIVTTGTTLVPCQQSGVPFRNSTQESILDQIRPYRGYRAINMIQPRFDSNYHSLQVSAQHRFSGASQVNLAYTWSKNLTDSQTDRSTAPQNPYDLRSEYGRAALDRRHIITVNYVYELPFYKSQNGFVGKALGGWETSGIVTYQTGLPFTATVGGYDPAGIGFIGPSAAGGRPDQIGNPNAGAPNTQEQFFNSGAFQTDFTQATGVPAIPGNAPRGSINGPRTFRVDMTLSKNIRFGESIRLQLRAEAFNLLNTTNFSFFGASASTFNADPTLNSFGRITSTRDPRTLQFGVKFYF